MNGALSKPTTPAARYFHYGHCTRTIVRMEDWLDEGQADNCSFAIIRDGPPAEPNSLLSACPF